MNRRKSLLLVLTAAVILAGVVLGYVFMEQTVWAQEKKDKPPVFARVTIVKINKDMVDEAIKLFADSVVPAAKSQKGYLGAHLLVDRETGKGVGVTIWETEADAIANEESGYYKEQVAKFKDIFTAPTVREGYEVAVSDIKVEAKE